MMNWGLAEWSCLMITALCILYPIWYFACGQLQKDIRKLRKLWQDTDPNGNPNDTP